MLNVLPSLVQGAVKVLNSGADRSCYWTQRNPREDGPVGPAGELLGALRQDLFLVLVAERR